MTPSHQHEELKMTTITKLTALALAALVASTTIASALPFSVRPGKSHSNYAVECRVHGDSFYVINWGSNTIDSGRQVSWTSPSTGDHGLTLMPKSLAPGEEVQLADVLSDTVAPGARCAADLV
jgi:hypothetical protein